MKKYKSKPVIIEADQFTNENKDMLLHDLQAINGGVYPTGTAKAPTMSIPTPEGKMTASIGDFIILGTIGELYPCKAEVFHKKYEPVGEHENNLEIPNNKS